VRRYRGVRRYAMKVKRKRGEEKKKNIKIHFEVFILISYCRKGAAFRSGRRHFCCFVLATPQRRERLLGVPKRNTYEGSRTVWRLICGVRSVLLTTDMPYCKTSSEMSAGRNTSSEFALLSPICGHFHTIPKTIATSFFFRVM
jgi:hypothetical protein